ncbi:MAG: glycosyltransferase family 2 protein [Ferruginibacter sp.]
MKITVITIVKNAGKVLRKTIESVCEQTYQPLEYIIVDGNSKDDSLAVIKSFGEGITKFISEPDKGIYNAMNKGIKMATGDLIIFLNSGDYFVSNDVLLCSLSKMKLENADIFYGRIIWNSPATKELTVSDHNYISKTWHLKADNFPHPATFYKSGLFKTIGLFDESFKIYGDYDWNVKALMQNRVAFQYIPVVTSVFTADGVSNIETLITERNQEWGRIFGKYFIPAGLYKKNFASHFFFRLMPVQKLLAKLYSCHLNRIY